MSANDRTVRKVTFREVLEEAQANKHVLGHCNGPHTFDPAEATQGLVTMFRCGKCGGMITEVEYSWYLLGMEHGRTHTCWARELIKVSFRMILAAKANAPSL